MLSYAPLRLRSCFHSQSHATFAMQYHIISFIQIGLSLLGLNHYLSSIVSSYLAFQVQHGPSLVEYLRRTRGVLDPIIVNRRHGTKNDDRVWEIKGKD